ncbi:3-hydroxyacyl-CoA dehydrogenase NAD-binding domain-containing protein [Microvirga sp. M2]|uniref:3-hydroxyacyl-CoA dehydrogenase NAD-binding domain-containing protein n=1 Tax=Microvirga sp. M2 TaxID=3073270 RepID=UPI0039C2CE76
MNTLFRLPHAQQTAASGIDRVAVIGAGSMGAGIAAQFANAGVVVDLLDIAGSEASRRNGPAETGVAGQLKSNGFMHPDAARLVRAGNVEDHLDRLSEADWIIEAVVERLDVKRELYRKIDAVRRPGSIVSSNTSTIPRAALLEDAEPTFRADFLITHFFNPPRMMRLVEIVATPENAPDLVLRAKAACENLLGKTVVDCRDTPGFIANRIGCYWIAVGILEAKRLGLTIEEADAAMVALGIPKTGVFGLLDLIGVDLVPHIWGSLGRALDRHDDFHRFDLIGDPLILSMIERGLFGRKAKAGFYRLAADKSREVLDLATGEYRRERPVSPSAFPVGAGRARALVSRDDRLGRYAASVLANVIAYAAQVGAEVASDVGAIDVAMTLGYAWKTGPFALADEVGRKRIAATLSEHGRQVPQLLAQDAAFFDAAGNALSMDGMSRSSTANPTPLARAKAMGAPLLGNDAASVWDLGDGVACFEIHTKMNSISPAVLEILSETIRAGGALFQALVIGNDEPRAFSAGADLSCIAGLARDRKWDAVESVLVAGQEAFLALKYAPFPVVAAAHGLTLGGGCELMLHADRVVAHAELNAGLPEAKVGMVPGWGGCTQLLVREQRRIGCHDPRAAAKRAFDIIFGAQPSTSALDASAKGLLRPGDAMVMHRDHVTGAAKALALALLNEGYRAPEPASLVLAGPDLKSEILSGVRDRHAAGYLTDHDMVIGEALATVLTGGAGPALRLGEREVMALERQAVMSLVKRPETQDRMAHILSTGKPLRN